MRNKILVVVENPKDKEDLEGMLQSIVEEGGEIFFTEKKEEALRIIKKENPQLVFLDSALIGDKEDDWVSQGAHIVLLCEKHQHQISEDFIAKPIRRHQVMEKCREVLPHEPAVQIPPM